MEEKTVNRGMGLLSIMFLILFTLKIIGKITLSWWWVTAPLWAPFAIGAVIGIVSIAHYIIKGFRDKKKNNDIKK